MTNKFNYYLIHLCIAVVLATGLALIGGGLLTTAQAQGPTLYVDAATGTVGPSDSCPTPRDSATYTTIQKAIDCAVAGDTVQVGAGTYSEAIDIDKSLTLQGNGRDDDANATRIDTTVVHSISSRSSCLVIADGVSDVTVTGFRFEGDDQQPSSHAYGDGENAIYFTSFDSANPISGITITNNTIVGTDRGIVTGGFLADSVISNNLLDSLTDWWTILVQTWNDDEELDNLSITGNEIRDSTSVPIAIMNYGRSLTLTNVLVENNYIHDNDASNPRTADHIWNREGQSGGIVARYGWDNMTIRNNTIVNNLDMSGIGIWGTNEGYENLTIESNILHNNTGSDRFSGGTVDPTYPASGIKVQWGDSGYNTSSWSVTEMLQATTEITFTPVSTTYLPMVLRPETPASNYGIWVDPSGNVSDNIGHIKNLGMGWVMLQMNWKEVEPISGEYSWALWDNLIDSYSSNEIEVMLTISKAPNWARPPYDDRSVEGLPQNPIEYAEFVALVTERYRDQVHAIEIWSGQNLFFNVGGKGYISATNYVELLKRSYEAIKSVDQDMIVISGSLIPAGNVGESAVDDIDYLDQMYDSGAKGYFDAVGANPGGYNCPALADWRTIEDPTAVHFRWPFTNRHHSWCFLGTMEGYREVMVSNDDTQTKIIVTEFGWGVSDNPLPGYDYTADNTYDEQAQWIVEAFEWGRDTDWVDLMILWNLDYGLTSPDTALAYFSLLRTDEQVPAYTAIADMVK